MKHTNSEKLTGVAVPLGALYTKDNPVIGEFPDLIPFAKFCKSTGIKIIQLLPVNDTGTQSSPYSGLSAFALHPIYLRLRDVEGFSSLYETSSKFKKQYDSFVKKNGYKNRYDYDDILNTKEALLKAIYEETDIGKKGKASPELSKFINDNDWVITYAVYKNLKWNYMQASWKSWIENDRHKTPEQIIELWNTMAFKKEHLFYIWEQMLCASQLEKAVSEVHKEGILIKGDMPIMMNEDSCDAWAYPQFFNQDLRAGSPADGENPEGQNWGFPTYNWKNLKASNYSWWINRLNSAQHYYDAYRLDHILGFFRIWAIPASDANALNGHTEPYAFIKKDELYEKGFDDDRIRWLSQPHIPTSLIEDITWNHELAHKILSIFCNQIGSEELWLFKSTIQGSNQIYTTNLNEFINEEASQRIKTVLVQYWSNKTLIEIARNKFIPLWTYNRSTSWQSLNELEKTTLEEMFDQLNLKNEKMWRKQSDEILGTLTKSVNMVPCGEDLGVGIACVPETMEKHDILGLRVVRWCRSWEKEGQPYVPAKDYTPLSVTTTSVHDSSTIRQWWQEEKDSVKAFIRANTEAFGITEINEDLINQIAIQDFSPETAQIIMECSGKTASCWYISPLQDFLYMNQKYWLENAADERINIPGTVTKFNWTYRLPASLEELSKDSSLKEKIINVSNR